MNKIEESEADPAQPESESNGALFELARFITWSLVFVVCLTTLARYWWLADLLIQFRIQYILILLFPLVVFVFKRRKQAAWLTFVFIALLSWPVAGYYFPGVLQPSSQYVTFSDSDEFTSEYRLLTFNVLTNNRQYEKAIEYIREQDPDFVVVIEVDSGWTENLKQLSDEYPYSEFVVRQDNFGIGLLSKTPTVGTIDFVAHGSMQLQSVSARFKVDDRTLHLLGTHPIPPLRPNTWNFRNQQLFGAAKEFRANEAQIMTGDFNLTPWSPVFRQLTKKNQLRDGSLGFGAQPTWHLFPTPLGGLKIDHALVSPDIEVTKFNVSPDLGSDHRAITVDFRLKK